MKVGAKPFARYLAGEYYNQTGNSAGSEAIKQATNVAEAKAIYEGQEIKLELRVAAKDGAFWYDLADDRNRAIRVTPVYTPSSKFKVWLTTDSKYRMGENNHE